MYVGVGSSIPGLISKNCVRSCCALSCRFLISVRRNFNCVTVVLVAYARFASCLPCWVSERFPSILSSSAWYCSNTVRSFVVYPFLSLSHAVCTDLTGRSNSPLAALMIVLNPILEILLLGG